MRFHTLVEEIGYLHEAAERSAGQSLHRILSVRNWLIGAYTVAFFRYTSNTVYNTFPWPQAPTPAQVRRISEAAVELRTLRRGLIGEHSLSLRKLYGSIERPGENPLKSAHAALNQVVRETYGMGKRDTTLEFLFELNQELFEREASLRTAVGPGLPPSIKNPEDFISADSLPFDLLETARDSQSEAELVEAATPSDRIFNWLCEQSGWHARAEILASLSDISAGAWSAAIRELVEFGEVERTGEKRGTKYRARRES